MAKKKFEVYPVNVCCLCTNEQKQKKPYESWKCRKCGAEYEYQDGVSLVLTTRDYEAIREARILLHMIYKQKEN